MTPPPGSVRSVPLRWAHAGTPTAGSSALLTLSILDDQNAGPVSTLRFGTSMSGNARVTALSPTLFVCDFSSGSQFSTYLVARDPETNALRIVGSANIAGDLGVAPSEVVALGPADVLPGSPGPRVPPRIWYWRYCARSGWIRR